MAYIGQGIKQGTFKVLDTSGNTYNGSNTTFNLGTQVGSAAQLLVSHDGVIQKAGTDYTLATGGTQITFSTAPASGASIFITEISGAVGGTVTPSDTSVTADKLNTALLTGHTDIGANIADADLFLVDDGAGGTLRKTAASRIKTYAGFSVSDITGATALDATPADTDEFIISDAGTLKRVDYSYIKGGAHILLQSGTFSNASNLTFNNSLITSTYNKYVVEFINCKLENDTYLSLFGSTDNGSSYGTSNAYQITGAIFEATQSSNSLFTRNNNGSADMTLIGNAQTVDLAYAFGLRVEIYNPTSTNQQKGVLFKGFYTHTSGDLAVVYGGGAFREGGNGAGTTAVNNIKFEPSNGDIASGIYRLYGVA